MKIQHFMALVVLSLGFKARTLGLLTLACLLAAPPATAQVNYAVSGGTARVIGSPNASGDIVIASTYNGYPVTSIGEWAFQNCTSLTSVTIPDSVTDIGQQAFQGCASLTNLSIGNGVTIIRISAFSGCANLASVSLPHSLAYIAYDAFGGCTSLTNLSVDAANPTLSSLDGVLFNKAQTSLIMFPTGRGSYVIPDSVTIIGARAFENCTILTNVIIPNSITFIGEGMFGGTGLRSVTVPNSVTNIGNQAFYNCTSLTNVSIPNSVTGIGSSAFASCKSLTSMTIPNSVTNIGSQAFAACDRLTVVTIPNSVTSIGVAAFMFCTNLPSITIPSSVTRIEDAAFSGCARLTNFTFLGNAPVLIRGFFEGGWFANVGAGAKAYYYCGTTGWGAAYGGLPTVMLCPPQVNYAVSGSTAYVTRSPNASGDVVIASTFNGYPVTSIGDRAFENCTSLTSVTIPDSVTQIGTTLYGGSLGFSFYNCTSLTNVIIGNNVTNIGYAAFVHCTSLTRLTIPASVINIASSAFAFCTSLTNVTFLGNPPRLLIDFEAGGYWFSNVGPGARAYYYCGTTGWGANYGGLPTVMLCPPGIAPDGAGVKPGGFGFTLTSLTHQTIVVEASTNLVHWQPIWTNPPPGTSVEFVDPEWLLHSNRFYRARSD